MSDDVWSARNTTPEAIAGALRALLRERHATNRALVPARVLNLVVIVDREWKGEIANRLARVGRYHASRTVLCTVEQDRHTLDATAAISFDETATGDLSVMHEAIEIDLGPEQLERLDTIIDPVLVSELATVLWSPHGHDEAVRAVLRMVDVVLVDSDDLFEPPEALERAAELLQSVYVVDLAWLRTTPWRERLAASFDLPDRVAALGRIAELAVRHRASTTASALLLAGWLSSRLHWEPEPLSSADGLGLRGEAREGDGDVTIGLHPIDQEVPGLGGVTVSCTNGFSLSLDRARGGLCAQERSPDGHELTWKVLGASRGEGGILGEGVRQALLRDPTYGPALDDARGFCAA